MKNVAQKLKRKRSANRVHNQHAQSLARFRKKKGGKRNDDLS